MADFDVQFVFAQELKNMHWERQDAIMYEGTVLTTKMKLRADFMSFSVWVTDPVSDRTWVRKMHFGSRWEEDPWT